MRQVQELLRLALVQERVRMLGLGIHKEQALMEWGPQQTQLRMWEQVDRKQKERQ